MSQKKYTRPKEYLKAHAFIHNFAKYASVQGLGYVVTTGRLDFEWEDRIRECLGVISFDRMFRDIYTRFDSKPIEYYNTKKIQQVSKELGLAIAERYPLYREPDLK